MEASTRFCAIREPVLALSWLKRTVLRLTALYSLTGTVTSPKLMAPVQMERGMNRQVCPTARRFAHLAQEFLRAVWLRD